ncbi:hypothetical protein BGZ97_005058 [Linnemannia gamsii]|uniref:Uncharacterized protein n=1 Tax=Linnemannia gamsii TaxID=64522 RepID=A0A9P6QTF6_9FUNG|nr:hypothetical protein BGZ97_005058 [Linnemannia gamsii]
MMPTLGHQQEQVRPITKMMSNPISDSLTLNNDSPNLHLSPPVGAGARFASDPEKGDCNSAASIHSSESSLGSTKSAELDPALIKKLRTKIDWRLVPLTSVLYLCSFLDRVNIGQ